MPPPVPTARALLASTFFFMFAIATILNVAPRSVAVGVEIDEEALETSRLNAAENGIGTDEFVALLPDEEAARGEQYDLLVANILAHTLIDLQDVLLARLRPGGTVLMSGVWGADQVEKVEAAYAGKGLSPFAVTYGEGGWALLQATRE